MKIESLNEKETIKSIPLEIVQADRNQLKLKGKDGEEFNVPASILPDRADVSRKLFLNLKKSSNSKSEEEIVQERQKRLTEMIN